LVTTGVPWLEDDEIATALAAGQVTATALMQQDGIAGAVLVLQDRVETVGLGTALLTCPSEPSIGDNKIGEACHA
jgi:hypothetical protein